MRISKSSWHARIYRWWCWDKDDSGPEGVNLCKYVRVVLFYGPLRWLFTGEVRGFPVAFVTLPFLIGSPLIFLTDWKVLVLVLSIYSGILLFLAIIASAIGLETWLDDRGGWRRIKSRFSSVGDKVVRHTSFFSILKLVYLSGKKKVCPYVDFS